MIEFFAAEVADGGSGLIRGGCFTVDGAFSLLFTTLPIDASKTNKFEIMISMKGKSTISMRSVDNFGCIC